MTSQAVLRVGRGWLAAVMFGACLCAQGAIMTKKDGQELPFVLTAAVRTATPPEIDGRLNDACWEEAAVADDFVLFGGRGYATVKTEARVLWDANNLYIGMRCFDANPVLMKTEAVERDGRVCGDDCVEIFLIPPNNSVLARFPASSRYFHLAVNSAGVCWDEIGSEAPDSWNARWTARTSVHDNRWEVELSIPWAELKSKPRHQDIWDVNFNRGFPKRDQAAAEYSGWSITFSGFHDPEYFGKIVFLDRWPGGKKTVDAQIAADIVRKTELEPPLKQAEGVLKSAQEKLRQLAATSEARQVKDAVAATNAQLAQTAGHAQALAKESAASLLTQWEKLRDIFRECQKDAAALLVKADFYGGLTLAQLRGEAPISDFQVFLLPAITNVKRLPHQLPSDALPGPTMTLTACPGEYESASFGIFALQNLNGIKVTASDLTGPAGTVPASALDLRVVKVWYQAGRNVGFQNLKLLTPELLLKDDSLVQIDEKRQINILKMDKDAMRDADVLQPFAVPANTFKQCWLTIQVPADAKAGVYRGTITIAPDAGAAFAQPVELTVLPFTLDEPKIICSIYYRGRLHKGKPVCNSERKTEEQLLAELKDMVAHGVTNPTVYQGLGPDLERYFQLRQEAGMRGGPLLFLGGSNPDNAKNVIALARKYGFTDVYFYGIDERSGDELRAQRAWYDRIHAAGGKVFVAGYKDSYEIMGDVLDLPIFAHRPDVAMGEAYHAMGHLIGSYANPQGGVEEPETYRRNYGLGLWKTGYDCACTYAYQHSFGHSWDDYDHVRYRDHEMAYPTVNGVIPTIQWEGYREGYDDLRYLATLENLANKHQRTPGKTGELARATQLWMRRLDPAVTPLDEIRAGIIERILALREAIAAP
ncbi:MAG: hypothetical protein GX937_12720 [Lentisphaerae bacterium]|nr:hypothetical protein [Lentisphaerota bacterium]